MGPDLDTNLKGAFFCAQAACAIMKAAGGGAIVNMCSLTSEVGIPTAVPYGSSKTGLLGMTRALSAEWAPHGIRVNAHRAGLFPHRDDRAFFETGGGRAACWRRSRKGGSASSTTWSARRSSLLSGFRSYMTGHCLAVDGGILASI